MQRNIIAIDFGANEPKLAPNGWISTHLSQPMCRLPHILPRSGKRALVQIMALHLFVQRLSADPKRLIGGLDAAVMGGQGGSDQASFMGGHLRGQGCAR